MTIIVDGEMRFIGNIQYLKNCCGQCFTIKVKLLDYKNANVEEIKSDMESNFAPNVVLKDEHKVWNCSYLILYKNIVLNSSKHC